MRYRHSAGFGKRIEFLQFKDIVPGEMPRVYVATPADIAAHMKTQCDGRGHGALQENYGGKRPGAKYDHRVPTDWAFSVERLNSIISNLYMA
jgi:hypothetical protein